MAQFREMAQSLISTAQSECEKLMYGWIPEVSLIRVGDNISDSSSGYSFLEDPVNNLSELHLSLLHRACLPGKYELIQDDQWNPPSVWRFLDGEHRLVVLFMQILYIFGGQCPRVRELLEIRVYNEQYYLRGVYIYCGTMMYLTTNHKAQNATNRKFYVARYLPKVPGQILFTYLACIRPLTSLLFRHVYDVPKYHNFLFGTTPRRNKTVVCRRLSTKDLTSFLRQTSQRTLGFPLLYRQITIAITEKHLKRLTLPLHQYDDCSNTADRDVVFAWQSAHRPRTRGQNYGIDGAFPYRLQPALLHLYKQASESWHQFLRRSALDGPMVQHYLRTPAVSPEEAWQRSEIGDQNQRPPLHLPPLALGRSHDPSQATLPASAVHANNNSQVLSATELSAPMNETSGSSSVQNLHPAKKRKVLCAPGDLCDFTLPLGDPERTKRSCPENRNAATYLDIGEDTLHARLIHLPQYRVIICDACPEPFAIVPDHLKAHLRVHHSNLAPSQRRRIVAAVDANKSLARRLEDVRYPPPSSARIEELPVYRDGIQCLGTQASGNSCEYICRSLYQMQQHCKKQHQWVNVQRRGGDSRSKDAHSPNRMWQNDQSCQLFFREGAWKRFFQVEARQE